MFDIDSVVILMVMVIFFTFLWRFPIQPKIKILSLNVLYDPRIPIEINNKPNPEHFFSRFDKIKKYLSKSDYDVLCFQEVHESFLEIFKNYAKENDFKMVNGMYHQNRKCHLVTLVKASYFVRTADPLLTLDGEWNKALLTVAKVDNLTYTIVNTHLPLDAKNTDERKRVTEKFRDLLCDMDRVIFIGDWNTLPNEGDAEQIKLFTEKGFKMPPINCVNSDGYPSNIQTTVYGFSVEEEVYQKFKTPTILDRVAIKGLDADADCHQYFYAEGCPLSDHFPLIVSVYN